MANLLPKNLYIGNDTASNVYTVSNTAGSYSIVRNINICNVTGTAATCDIYLLDTAGTPGNNNAILNNLNLNSNLSGSWWFPILLVGTGIFFTIYLGFPQFRFFGKAWKLVSGKNNKSDEEGETTGFEALTTAMSGAVGTGNIGGVALAIWTGGPAAIFWMWITAIFGMTTKFVEVTMGHKYRTKLEDGSISGGPMYYIEHALNMKWAGILFAFLMMISKISSD